MPDRITEADRDFWRRQQREAAIQEAAIQRERGRLTDRDTSSLEKYMSSLQGKALEGRRTARPDVRHWQARLEDRPIEEGISAMEFVDPQLTDDARARAIERYESRDKRFVPRPEEWKRMTDFEQNLWLGPKEPPLNEAIQESLMSDADREFWLERATKRKGKK